MFNRGTRCRKLCRRTENVGAGWRQEHRWCYQSLPRQDPPDCHWKKPQEKKNNQKKQVGDICICFETELRCHRPSWNMRICQLLSWHRAWRAELSSGKKNTTTVGARKTQRVYSAPSPPPPAAGGSSPAQLHREEKPAGVELILACTEEGYARPRAICCPQGREEECGALWTTKATSRNVPSVCFMNLYL